MGSGRGASVREKNITRLRREKAPHFQLLRSLGPLPETSARTPPPNFRESEKGRGVTDRGVTALKILRGFERFSEVSSSLRTLNRLTRAVLWQHRQGGVL